MTSEGHLPLVCTPDAERPHPLEAPSSRPRWTSASTCRCAVLTRDLPLPILTPTRNGQRCNSLRTPSTATFEAQDVRLTMGGEPTFVGIDEVESPQWNLEALGSLKRTRGLALIRRLRDKIAPGGVLHFGQGKWYPGEALPRWAFHCISPQGWRRRSGRTCIGSRIRHPAGATSRADALAFLQALSRRLQVSTGEHAARHPNPGRRLRRTGGLHPALAPPAAMGNWSGRASSGSRVPNGSSLRRATRPSAIASRSRRCRGSLPTNSFTNLRVRPSPTASSFPRVRRESTHLFPDCNPLLIPYPPLSSTAETAKELIRPALCVQVREGRLHVFLPYAPVAADYLDLVAAIEDTCAHLQKPVWLEGYPPPSDPAPARLQPHPRPWSS